MITILGAGSMGCLWAAHLSSLHTTQFVSTRNTTITEKEFSLTSLHHNSTHKYTIPIKTFKQITQPIKLLLVCTKSYDTYPALIELKTKISRETTIVLFQNGLGSQFEIINEFPDNAILSAVTTEGVNSQLNGRIIHAGIGSTNIGIQNKPNKYAQSSQYLLDNCFNYLGKSKLVVEIQDNIWKFLWRKLAVNCAINPFTAIIDCPNGEIKQHDFFKLKWPSLKKELANLLTLENHPITEEELEHIVFNVIKSSRNNISSMLQDIRNNKKTEINDINGFAAQRLKSKGEPGNINLEMWKRVSKLQDNYLSQY